MPMLFNSLVVEKEVVEVWLANCFCIGNFFVDVKCFGGSRYTKEERERAPSFLPFWP